jgi:hypothetical protein
MAKGLIHNLTKNQQNLIAIQMAKTIIKDLVKNNFPKIYFMGRPDNSSEEDSHQRKWSCLQRNFRCISPQYTLSSKYQLLPIWFIQTNIPFEADL